MTSAHETTCEKKSEKPKHTLAAYTHTRTNTHTCTHRQTSAEIQQRAERNLFYSHFPHTKIPAARSEKLTIASYNRSEGRGKTLRKIYFLRVKINNCFRELCKAESNDQQYLLVKIVQNKLATTRTKYQQPPNSSRKRVLCVCVCV